jgi:anti-sigma regulatory factor (Ser/Thr protein kinase)
MRRRVTNRIQSDMDVTHAVVAATNFARQMQFQDSECRSIGTVVSELATNILKYADFGQVTLREIERDGHLGIEVTVTDRGPGIDDVQQALQDSFSTSGTLGMGLPGVRRIMDEFELDSEVDSGTRVRATKWLPSGEGSDSQRTLLARSTGSDAFAERGTERWRQTFVDPLGKRPNLDVAYVVRPCRGELMSGDAVSVQEVQGGVLLTIVDGLGHGIDASRAAKLVTRFLRQEADTDLGNVFRKIDDRLRDSVGAAMGLCHLDLAGGRVRYLGVGNTALRIEGDRTLRIESVAGTVGAFMKPTHIEDAQMSEGAVLLMYTDGVSDRDSFSGYPQLRYQDPATVVETILSRYGRYHDDATCLACRYTQ